MRKTHFISTLLLLLCLTTSAQISSKNLIKKYSKTLEGYDYDLADQQSVFMEGQMEIGQLKDIPVRVWMQNNFMKLEMEFLGTKLTRISNDTLEWQFDPFSNKYNFEPASDQSNNLNFVDNKQNDVLHLLDSGWEPSDVKELVLFDTLDVYELVLTNDVEGTEESKTFYFDQNTYYVIGTVKEGAEEYYFDYKLSNEMLLPHRFIYQNATNDLTTFNVSKFDFSLNMTPEEFEMSEQTKKAYAEFILKQKEKSPALIAYEEGVEAFDNQEYDRAIERFDEANRLAPNDITVLSKRGAAKRQHGDQYGAISDFNRVIELRDTIKPVDYNNLGLSKYYLNDNEGAKSDYLKAIELDSTDATILRNMALLQFRFQDYDKVVDYYSKSFQYDSTNAIGFYYRGVANAELGNYELAVDDYSQAQMLNLNEAPVYNYKGVALYYLERYDSAIVNFERAMAMDSSNVQYSTNYANALTEVNNYADAIEVYETIVLQDSTQHSAWADMAISKFEISMTEQAIHDISVAIKLVPNAALYYDHRARMKEAIGDYLGAVEDFTSSLDLEQDSNIYYERGLAKINLSNKFDACKDFKKAAEMGDENGKSALEEHCKL
ncbi:tetratricopeptide repeat protein [Roseivirga pacifica]|uniref:Tetratricopeptide repeat-containing protein n=1 Tax=Roseivirga pacifica TaxID=1267423 RepID=A0A1I0QAM3_9BACT|nr:tetratricopeptide repeat protein [Roseivirga pacifica]RKQ43091.1 tetratricopeptide repeat protein [Roseivirga pacifica]SEW24087.1 Tetratricopeptide repeat-containing protein [Roseivirga pacifica]